MEASAVGAPELVRAHSASQGHGSGAGSGRHAAGMYIQL